MLDEKVKRSTLQAGERDKSKATEFIYELNPWEALRVLQKIPQEQWLLVNVAGVTRIHSFIVQDLVVPPVCIRPSLNLTTSTLSNEDDLTMNIKCLIKLNKEIS